MVIDTLKEDSILSLCEEVVSSEQLQKLGAGTVILKPGDKSQNVYVIKSGIFKIGIEYDKSVLTIGFLIPGDLTGLVGLHHSVEYPYFIQSVTDSELYVWERSRISELMNIIPEIGNKIKDSFTEWGIRVIERIKTLVFLAPYQRVAAWVKDYSTSNVYRDQSLWVKISKRDMAEYCFVKEADFEMSLKQLEEDGIISLKNNDCLVRDQEKLNFLINSSR
jgi:CRP-like cAMP-binding protein